jgi:hypothetical protein
VKLKGARHKKERRNKGKKKKERIKIPSKKYFNSHDDNINIVIS